MLILISDFIHWAEPNAEKSICYIYIIFKYRQLNRLLCTTMNDEWTSYYSNNHKYTRNCNRHNSAYITAHITAHSRALALARSAAHCSSAQSRAHTTAFVTALSSSYIALNIESKHIIYYLLNFNFYYQQQFTICPLKYHQ